MLTVTVRDQGLTGVLEATQDAHGQLWQLIPNSMLPQPS